MKIAVFHNVPPGGAKRVIYEQIKSLKKRHEIDIYHFSSTNESFMDIRPFAESVFTYEFELESKREGVLNRLEKDYKNFVSLSFLSEKMAKDINSRNYDVALVHPDKFTQTPFILRFLHKPKLYFCEETLRLVYEEQFMYEKTGNFIKDKYETITRNIRKFIDSQNITAADLVVANSDFTKNQVKKAYDIESKSCLLGVDTNIFKAHSGHKKNNLVFLGNKEDKVGFEFMSSIYKLVKNYRKLKLDQVNMYKKNTEPVTDYQLAIKYSTALAILCTHKNEPFGLGPLESMACETPVLAVNEGGYKETVVGGVTGYLLPRDPKAFAEKIKYLWDNPDVARKMGKAGREHVKKNFTWEKHNKRLEKLLIETARMKK